MSANVGLSTPRGSGTSGYVQRNAAHLRPRDQPHAVSLDLLQHRQRQPDKQILAHEKAREIEVKVFELRDELEEQGLDEDEIDTKCEALRQNLAKEGHGPSASGKGLKKHQVHEMAAAKIEESDRLRRALGISKDYEEGSHWKKQEERLRGSLQSGEDGDRAEPMPKERDHKADRDTHREERPRRRSFRDEDEDREERPRRRESRDEDRYERPRRRDYSDDEDSDRAERRRRRPSREEDEDRYERPRKRDHRRYSPSRSRSRSRSPR